MATIRNFEDLIRNGATPKTRKARRVALNCLQHVLDTADPKAIIKARVTLKRDLLRVDKVSLDLKKFKKIFVIGGGKASGSMAEALEHVLGQRITSGLVNIPYSTSANTSIIRLHHASHPMPDESGAQGSREMLKIAEQAGADDLIICLISGGGSSLMPLPLNGITINEKREITEVLLKCGATINEINTLRKHISGFKGGWLARKAYPATLLNLILSDVVGDPLDFIASGPTVPDSTTFAEATTVLKRYNLWDQAPAAIKKTLTEGQEGRIPETPKQNDKSFKKVLNVVIGNCMYGCLAACESLKKQGLRTLLLTSTMEGEAKHVGVLLSSIANEITSSGNPMKKPLGIVIGGETTVTVRGKGKGGRNQELELAAMQKLGKSDGVVIASLATDGVDGTSDAAGAVVDGKSAIRARNAHLESQEYLANNDSNGFFSKLDDLICTGPSGTNINDISVIVVL